MMSQASNKVDWCLSKAKKEIAESGTHRGLIEQEAEDKLAGLHIKKATHNLNAALFFEKNGYSDWSASAFFYSMYHCFLAILSKFGYESRNQECTIAVVEMLNEQGKIRIDDKFIRALKITQAKEAEESVIKIREELQYGTNTQFERKEQLEELTLLCKEAIEAASKIVYR